MIKEITAKYPSNIALVKYWGKHGNQLPRNASLSMTLQKAFTETNVQLSEKGSNSEGFLYFFEDKENKSFGDRVFRYLNEQQDFKPLLEQFDVKITSRNSFPHSAGIASSASSFASIAAAFLKLAQPELSEEKFNREASHLARLGSGSACRSFFGPYALWGITAALAGSSDEYALPVMEIHNDFMNMTDAILIVEDEPKKVSSSVGHGLMKNHPYATARFEDAEKHCTRLLEVLKAGDFDSFISITEREALSLHAMMMTSGDYYMLMKPGTVQIIERIFEFRTANHLPICFTLDAGPNVHLLYPEAIQKKVQQFIEQDLKGSYKSVLMDECGDGGSVF